MPYLIYTLLYPTDKASEVAKRYIEALGKYPPDENLAMEVAHAIKGTSEGLQTIGVYDVKKGKLEEAYNRLANIMVMFYSIQGFKYQIDIYLKVEEATGFIGRSLPG